MGARILLVEDDPDVKLLEEHLLLTAGYEVRAVETATRARELIEGLPFDLLIADGKLADGNGADLADHAAQRGIKTLIVTGNALSIPAEQLARHAVLWKPAKPGELLAIVERLLAQEASGATVVPLRKPT